MTFFKRWLSQLFCYILPKGTKRSVFLTTLFMEVSKISPTHRDIIKSINTEFNLVRDDNALDLTLRLHSGIWSGRHLDTTSLNDKDIDGLANRLINEFPGLTTYGDKPKVLSETKAIIAKGLSNRTMRAAE